MVKGQSIEPSAQSTLKYVVSLKDPREIDMPYRIIPLM